MAVLTIKRLFKLSVSVALAFSFSGCVSTTDPGAQPSRGSSRVGNMGGKDITVQARQQQILNEPTGNFFYGRRYYVEKTRFWGYVRKPRQPWSEAKLVLVNESSMRQPDRLPENGPWNARHGFDNNYDYRLTGYFTGRKIYEPASNLFLPEFKATGFTTIRTKPGWLFRPQDYYNSKKVTLVNKSISQSRAR